MEETFIKIVGIGFISVHCLRVLIISSIRAYEEILSTAHKSARLIARAKQDEIELELERIKNV